MHRRIRRVAGAVASAALVAAALVALDAAPAAAAYPVPPTPANLTKSIEALQPYIGQSTCDPVAKPGVSAFRNLLLRTYTDSGSLGIVRDCGSGGQSEHKEGRAFDWAMKVSNTRQRAEVSTLLSWLLKTDQYGNSYAMARRFGIMYMIWNKQIWKAYDAADGWQAYSGPNPHTDHVHFSFGWNGAKKTTSYWDGTVAGIDFGPSSPPKITPVRSVANIATVRQYGGLTLRQGSGGEAVKVVQRGLKVSPVDGDFGPQTALYVMKFQSDQGLSLTGRFGPTEWRRLFPYPIAPFGAIDTPSYVLGNAVVRGWAIDADTTDPIQVSAYVDGVLVETEPAALPRSDVNASFPEWGSTHGFLFALPLVDGEHQLCLTAVNASGTPGTDTALGCRTISAQHNPVGALESAVPALGSVTVTGWAVDPDSADALTTSLTVDGAPSTVVPETVTRTDIAQRFPGVSDGQGVRAALDLPEGTHQVCLLAGNADGTEGSDATVGCRSVVVQHTPVASLDLLRRSPEGVSVRGWALDPDVTSPAVVEVLSDGKVVQSPTASLTRTDLPAAYAPVGKAHGFSTALTLPVGKHQVCVRVRNATGTPGNDLSIPCRSVTVGHDGAGVLSVLRTVPGGTVRVTGDAYDPDTLQASPVFITSDGVGVKTVTANLTSSTASSRWPGYGSAHAFSTSLSLPRGRHSICVWARSVAGTEGRTSYVGCRTVTVHDGVGAVTSWSRSNRTVTFRGWAIDPDTKSATKAALVVDGRVVSTVLATRTRDYLGSTVMPGYGTDHGVTFVRTLTAGTHRLCLISRNVTGTAGVSMYVGCRTITVR
jgi:peptidoglycan hydrolase-like protein with peptidoglycan-binding domain